MESILLLQQLLRMKMNSLTTRLLQLLSKWMWLMLVDRATMQSTAVKWMLPVGSRAAVSMFGRHAGDFD